MMWKDDWDRARGWLLDWWKCEGPAFHITAPSDEPWEPVPDPGPPKSLEQQWLDPEFRVAHAEFEMARTYHGGVAFPYFDTQIGPGSLGLFLGSGAKLAPDTVWYEPSGLEPGDGQCLTPDFEGDWWQAHEALIQLGLERANGRYLVGMPDLIEGMDTLAQLREPQALLMDMLENPDWVHDRLLEIANIYDLVFRCIYGQIVDSWGGNAFSAFKIWGPGQTAKVQCDMSTMFSGAHFSEFVVPYLHMQCEKLDFAMFHLDGEQAMHHLDALLSIDSLHAIEWTPQPGVPSGGDLYWKDMYKYIISNGKSVQAIGVRHDEVLPLYEAVGTKGLFVIATAPDEKTARRLVREIHG